MTSEAEMLNLSGLRVNPHGIIYSAHGVISFYNTTMTCQCTMLCKGHCMLHYFTVYLFDMQVSSETVDAHRFLRMFVPMLTYT